MSRKKPKSDGVYFLGKASVDVTGSQYLVRFNGHQCLLECGLHQSSSNDYLDSYKINSEKFQFNPSDIEYVFACHTHIDHIGLIPRLVKEGFNGRIIATRNTAMIMKPLLLNSCFIIQDEARILSKRYKRNYKPLYDVEDVYKTLELIDIYDDYDTIFQLNDVVSFQWFKNSHCLGAAQLQLILKSELATKKILYTSDLGALNTDNHFLENTEIPEMYNDISIMESTYGNSKRQSKKTRSFDIEHLRVAVNTVLERNGSIIMPCFSFSRTQELLATLYDIYGNDENFKTQIIIDSKLSCDITRLYNTLLHGDSAKLWDKIYNWKNLKLISEKEESKSNMMDFTPKIIISSSGFCTNGRIVNYLKRYLPDKRSMIVFSGYVGDNPSYLSYRIKNYREHKHISINKELVKNNADCVTLSTYSSHANYNDLIRFGSSLNTNKLILVHGSEESKQCLADGLRDAVSKQDKTFKIISATKGMVAHL